MMIRADDQANFYNVELKRCRATLTPVIWLSETISKAELKCANCGSGLIEQEDPDETDQEAVALQCKACGEEQQTDKTIEIALDVALAGEAYSRAKDEGLDGPVFTCPQCSADTFVDFEAQCAACGFEAEGDAECARCGGEIELDVRLYGDNANLCGYCAHMTDKIMRE